MNPDHYDVLFTPAARVQALAAAEYIARSSPRNAARWYEGLEKAILSLELFPHRCGAARENEFSGEDLRQFIYKSHGVIFRIEERPKTVHILHVRHAAQRAIGEPPGPEGF
jgi:plasmid stabilization system protein ParE